MLKATDEQRKYLRRVKSGKLVETARNSLVCDCVEQGQYIQFATDVVVYGLWEALLLSYSSEPNGFLEGASQRALDKVIKHAGI